MEDSLYILAISEELRSMLSASISRLEQGMLIHCALLLLMRERPALQLVTRDDKRSALRRAHAWQAQAGCTP